MKKYFLYSITCKANNKVYIGVCSWYAQRIGKHKYDLRRNSHANYFMQEDYNLFGEDSFDFDIIQSYDYKKDAEIIEKYYTDNIFGLNKDYCYNIISGGGNIAYQIRGLYKTKLENDLEFKKKISASISSRMKGVVLSNETKDKIRKSAIGRKASEETKKIFSDARKGGGNSRAKKVIDTSNNKIYSCLKDAAIDLGINYDTIRARINGYNKQKTSLQWL